MVEKRKTKAQSIVSKNIPMITSSLLFPIALEQNYLNQPSCNWYSFYQKVQYMRLPSTKQSLNKYSPQELNTHDTNLVKESNIYFPEIYFQVRTWQLRKYKNGGPSFASEIFLLFGDQFGGLVSLRMELSL